MLYVSLSGRLQQFFHLIKVNNKNAFLCNFRKTFRGPSSRCQKFLELKSLSESRNLQEFWISVIKTGGFFIRFLVKTVRKFSKSKIEK